MSLSSCFSPTHTVQLSSLRAQKYLNHAVFWIASLLAVYKHIFHVLTFYRVIASVSLSAIVSKWLEFLNADNQEGLFVFRSYGAFNTERGWGRIACQRNNWRESQHTSSERVRSRPLLLSLLAILHLHLVCKKDECKLPFKCWNCTFLSLDNILCLPSGAPVSSPHVFLVNVHSVLLTECPEVNRDIFPTTAQKDCTFIYKYTGMYIWPIHCHIPLPVTAFCVDLK